MKLLSAVKTKRRLPFHLTYSWQSRIVDIFITKLLNNGKFWLEMYFCNLTSYQLNDSTNKKGENQDCFWIMSWYFPSVAKCNLHYQDNSDEFEEQPALVIWRRCDISFKLDR